MDTRKIVLLVLPYIWHTRVIGRCMDGYDSFLRLRLKGFLSNPPPSPKASTVKTIYNLSVAQTRILKFTKTLNTLTSWSSPLMRAILLKQKEISYKRRCDAHAVFPPTQGYRIYRRMLDTHSKENTHTLSPLFDGKWHPLLWSPTLSTFCCVETNSDLFHCACLQFVTSRHLSPPSPVIRTDLSVYVAVLEMEPQKVSERQN